jgi:hypothetical protein
VSRPPRFAKKRDENEPDIIRALEGVGALVLQLDHPSRAGVPDLLVAFRGVYHLLEVKHPARAKAHPDVQAAQAAFREVWPNCHKVESVEHALRSIGAIS